MYHKCLFENIYVVAKFFMSKAPNGQIYCVSRTLGKFSLIDNKFTGKVEDQDVWVCKITKELKPGQNSGAFILMPIKRIEDPNTQVRKIIPGFYDFQKVGKAALVRPNTDPKDYWVLSKITRQLFKKYYAVIVPIAFQEKVEVLNEDDIQKHGGDIGDNSDCDGIGGQIPGPVQETSQLE